VGLTSDSATTDSTHDQIPICSVYDGKDEIWRLEEYLSVFVLFVRSLKIELLFFLSKVMRISKDSSQSIIKLACFPSLFTAQKHGTNPSPVTGFQQCFQMQSLTSFTQKL
jgi:hypothetical protein